MDPVSKPEKADSIIEMISPEVIKARIQSYQKDLITLRNELKKAQDTAKLCETNIQRVEGAVAELSYLINPPTKKD